MDTYYATQQEYRNAKKLYSEEDCSIYRGSSRARLHECSELNTIIQTSVIMRTLIKVTQGWNSCIYLSCTDLLTIIGNQLQYKIALVLVTLAIISYSMKLFRCTKKKSKDYIHKKNYQITQKAFMDKELQMKHLLNSIHIPSTVSLQSSSGQ